MKQEAYQILKTAIIEHRELLLSSNKVCLGVLRDYGGREHPEVKLFAEALEENIPDRLLRSQPITQDVIDNLASNFATTGFHDPEVSTFVVSSWADALGLYKLEPSILTKARISAVPESSSNERTRISERSWYYQAGTHTLGPLLESRLTALVNAGNIDPKTWVWSEGMTNWESASDYFRFLPQKVSASTATSSPRPSRQTTTRSVITPTTGHTVARTYGGLNRKTYILGSLGAGIGISLASGGSENGLVLIGVISFILAIYRIKNIGASGWWVLLLLAPLVNVLAWIPLVVCQEGYYDAKKLDSRGLRGIGIAAGFLILVVLIAIFWDN